MENFPINDYRRLFLRIFQHPSYRKLPCAQRSNYTRRYSLRHPSWGTFPILTNRSDNSRCFFNTRFVGNLMCLESSILDRPPFNTRLTGNFMRCSSHKSLISFFQHPSYGKQCLLGLIGIFNTRLMGNCIRSLSLHQIQHLSTPTLWETPHYPYVGGPGIPLSTPLLWETYAVVNGPTATRLPFSTPVLREATLCLTQLHM